jgi:hypothetical protein
LFSVDPKRFILTERQGKIEGLGAVVVTQLGGAKAPSLSLTFRGPEGPRFHPSFEYPGTVDDMAASVT